MPANARIIAREQLSELQGANRLVPVIQYTVETLPSHIQFQFRRPKTTDKATVASVAEQLADRFEAVLAGQRVIDLDYFQDTTASGQLRDMVRVFWETLDGRAEGHFDEWMPNLGPAHTFKRVDEEVAEADAELAL